MYIITEWFERYEVNEKGRSAKAGDILRTSPLNFIRSKVHGRQMSSGFARMKELAGDQAYEVFGIFHKLLEFAACETSDKRGKLLNNKGKPATIADLAFDLHLSVKKITFALGILTNSQVLWLQKVRNTSRKLPETPGNSRILPDDSGIPSEEKSNRIENEDKRNKEKRSLPENPGESSTNARASSLSTHLDFSNRLRQILHPKNKADLSALWNLQNWSKAQGDGVLQRIIEIAEDSKKGRSRMAVFFSRIKDELGYRPNARKSEIEI